MDETTRPLVIDVLDGWALLDLLTVHLAGFGARAEEARPWDAESLVKKLCYALPRMAGDLAVSEVTLDLTRGELTCLVYNVPQTAYERARALLLRVFHCLAEMDFSLPILLTEPPETAGTAARLGLLRGYGAETISPDGVE